MTALTWTSCHALFVVSGPAKKGGWVGFAPRLLLTTYLTNHARCSSTDLRLRSSSSIGLSPPLAPGTWVEYISPMNSAWSETATQSSGRPMLCFWPLIVTSFPCANW